MEFVKIVLLCVFSAICYGIVHDQITARVCVEYFTIGHPPVFHTVSPTLLGLGWGVIATWWVGMFLGVPLAAVSRWGNSAKLTAKQLAPAILRLLSVMAILALTAGIIGYVLAARGNLRLTEMFGDTMPHDRQVRFVADWSAHLASYAGGFFGGVVVIVLAWKRRRTQH